MLTSKTGDFFKKGKICIFSTVVVRTEEETSYTFVEYSTFVKAQTGRPTNAPPSRKNSLVIRCF
jgi:hypothetical protein